MYLESWRDRRQEYKYSNSFIAVLVNCIAGPNSYYYAEYNCTWYLYSVTTGRPIATCLFIIRQFFLCQLVHVHTYYKYSASTMPVQFYHTHLLFSASIKKSISHSTLFCKTSYLTTHMDRSARSMDHNHRELSTTTHNTASSSLSELKQRRRQ